MREKAPYSTEFDDIYFYPEDGIGESTAVFLDGVDAPEIWQGQDEFITAELGFGTGLNFLLTAKLWLETAEDDQKLIYYSTEKYPLKATEIDDAIHWPELQDVKAEMLNAYPDGGQLFDGRIELNILLGDSLEELRKHSFKANAWYLDGFAPSKNPDMWLDDIFSEVARLSASEARLATFTAAGFVRRGLMEKGYDMSKRPGFGNKREMLSGVFKNKGG
ncbi:tRNA (5-methylaminomethyl-2-thiouridine)(34)-methyltransferase MnmD [Pseudemcibacter aquimaris]|uniref:tRNA (5-methylaminomethyl-2-thiouridine)(34)-methyltransferase MnmD n=1 Tax=Pseudemcibacter aquimaris TaxID=2857064 RepID=UPI00201383B4|nr:tRNA (5-methylaminomethyl-2-thiouridine)(34)-methyltransferase MnmD [Pseudemcibacter aquimaris]MCC3860401.1 tRNA (5-methylaminomethyl-2-thiouridine)(34)-methyltransferase MnmD [Pseudemcibacter aquimaris]WDU57727.1 tRNA (5-methylaminomethyl-2-thiouridine)(34)-methyltransferase MnmD [Pseudemcibacter aquimaris]